MATSKRRRRTERYCDPEDAFQKVPDRNKGFASTFICKYVKALVSADISEILKLQKEEINANNVYRISWLNAQGRYVALKKVLDIKNKGKPKLPDECHIAIIAYTMESSVTLSLYADFNNKCRGLTSDSAWQNFPYKSYYALLARAIHGIKNNPDVNVKKYHRGIKHKINYLKEGDYIFPAQFLSCSIDEEVARDFMGDDGDHGTLITFKGSPLAAIGIVEYSDFPDEEEMLVFPWSTYKVLKIERKQDEDHIVLESVGPIVKDFPYSGSNAKHGISFHAA